MRVGVPTVSLLVALLSAVGWSRAELCYRPADAKQCRAATFLCDPVDEAGCRQARGTFQRGSGPCGDCDRCVREVGVGEQCNVDGVVVTSVCRAPLQCSIRNRCVEDCDLL